MLTIQAGFPLAVALAGALTYALAASPALKELGRIAWFTGLLVTLLSVAGQHIRL